MISFSILDFSVLFGFFIIFLILGFAFAKRSQSVEEFILAGRSLGMPLFVMVTVSTWYGGILGVGEYAYRYGISSWFTQGLPYYIFAFLFAILFAKKIRSEKYTTIPEKITSVYGRHTGMVSGVFVFLLVSPAPYLLMSGQLLSLLFDIPLLPALFISAAPIAVYLIFAGFRGNVYTDAFLFLVMFGGFIVTVVTLLTSFGFSYLPENLPEAHLSLTGGASPIYLLVWFFIALWTFADPGFHQRSAAAKTSSVAVNGIFVSIIFWMLFDFLTNTTGLFARALLPDLEKPVLAYPLLAQQILPSGMKGFFFAALFATILSTLNSFLFLSGAALGKDLIAQLRADRGEESEKKFLIFGIIISSLISVLLAWAVASVIEIWYSIGSVAIPGLLFLIFGAYFPRLRTSYEKPYLISIASAAAVIVWYFLRKGIFAETVFAEIEPMIAGLAVVGICFVIDKARKKY